MSKKNKKSKIEGCAFISKEPMPTFLEWMELKLKEAIESENYEEAEKLKKEIKSYLSNVIIIK